MPRETADLASNRAAAESGSRLAAALLLAVFIGLLYLPAYLRLGDALLAGRADLWGYFAPMAFYLDASLRLGQWPEWNPLIFCGTPFAANPQAALYYPPQLLRALLCGGAVPWHSFAGIWAMQMLHLWAAGFGAFLLGRRHGLGWIAGLLAACIYVGAAPVAFRSVQHWQFLAMHCWLPWLLLALHAALGTDQGSRRTLWTLTAGAIVGLAVLVGFPQLTLYLFVFMGGYVCLLCMAVGGGWHQRWRRGIPLLGIALCLGLWLAAPSLWPGFELAGMSARAKDLGSGVDLGNPKAIHPLLEPLALLKALLVFSGERGLRFAGGGAVFLALGALWHPARRTVLLFLAMFLLGLDLCLGPPFPAAWLVAHLAPFKLAEPDRAAILTMLPLSMLAGFGLEALMQRRERRAVLAALGALIVVLLFQWLWQENDLTGTRWLWLFPALGLLAYACGGSAWRAWAAGGVALAALVELTAWNHLFLEHLIRQDAYPGDFAGLRETQEWSCANERGVGERWLENAQMFSLAPVINGYDPLVVEGVRQFMSAPGVEGAYKRRTWPEEVREQNLRARSLLSQRFWLADDLLVPGLPPKASVFNPAAAVYTGEPSLSAEAPAPIPEGKGNSGTMVEVRDCGPNRVQLKVQDLPAPKQLVFTETFYPGWGATLDGEPVEIARAYGVFQRVRVPAGTHEVAFQFSSTRARQGRWLGASAVAFFFVAALGAALLGRREARTKIASQHGGV